MTRQPYRFLLISLLVAALHPSPASGQVTEAVGNRALGMAGAFVAVANDNSATWWNPGGLAAGPFLDVGLNWAGTSIDEALPARRQRVTSFAITTPPFGFSYHRFRLTEVRAAGSIAQDRADRQDGRAEMPIGSLSASQLGATFVQTLGPGVHAGTTLKYVRGTFRTAPFPEGTSRPSDLLELGDDLEVGDAEGRFDLDIGVLGVVGAWRVGAVARNVVEAEFGEIKLPRQFRLGAAFDGDAIGLMPLVLALDADVRRYDTALGPRRMVAVGGEYWLYARRLGVRGGARVNSVRADERAVTGGISVAPRAGLYVEGHLVVGTEGEDGWGLGARVSF